MKKQSSPPSSSSSRSTKKLRYRPAPCHRGRPTHRAKQRRSGSPTALESDVLTKQQPPRSRRREAPGSKPPRQEANTYTPQATTMVAWRSRRGTHRDKNYPRIQARKRQTSSALHNPLASTAGREGEAHKPSATTPHSPATTAGQERVAAPTSSPDARS